MTRKPPRWLPVLFAVGCISLVYVLRMKALGKVGAIALLKVLVTLVAAQLLCRKKQRNDAMNR